MDRRSFVLGVGAAVVSSNLCAMQDNVGGLQRAYVAQPDVIRQECAAWCWAASSSMIFGMLGHPVDQKRIVQRLYPDIACKTSGPTVNIVRGLNEPWVDDNGKSFQPRVVAAYDPSNGIDAISNPFIVNELVNNRALLYCNTDHAMVIVDFNYILGPGNVIVPQQIGVLDPWPYSPAYHPLSQAEATGITRMPPGEMTFLAAVQV